MNIKELRMKTGMKQKEFAEKFGIPVRTLQDWENPSKSNPPAYVAKMLGKFVENGSSEIIPPRVTFDDDEIFEQRLAEYKRYNLEVQEKFDFVCEEIERMVKRMYPQSEGERALSLYAGITPQKAGDELREFVLSLSEDKEICWLGKKIIVGKGFEGNRHCWKIRFQLIGEVGEYDAFANYFGASHLAMLEIYFTDDSDNILEKKSEYYI